MRRQGRPLLSGSLCLAALLLSASQAQTVPSGGASVPAVKQDRVPIVRPLALVAMAEPLVVKFHLDPPGRNGTSTVLVAVRVSGADGAVSRGLASSIQNAGVPARVQLIREGDDGDVPVPLVRVEEHQDGSGTTLPVAANGQVSRVWLDDADDLPLEHAGLADPQRDYRQLALAWVENLPPGRYRLSFQILDPKPDLATIPAELLVAYRHKSK